MKGQESDGIWLVSSFSCSVSRWHSLDYERKKIGRRRNFAGCSGRVRPFRVVGIGYVLEVPDIQTFESGTTESS